MIKHGLRALRDTLPSEVELTTKVIDVHIYNEHMSDIIHLPSCIILGPKRISDVSFCCRIAHLELLAKTQISQFMTTVMLKNMYPFYYGMME